MLTLTHDRRTQMALANRKIGYDEVVTRDLHFPMNLETVARHWFNNDQIGRASCRERG